MTALNDPIFNDEDAARKHIERSRWADGVVCPHCGSLDTMRMAGKTQAGMFLCRDCRDKFTCRMGTVMERSHVPLHKWLLGLHLMASSKKGISAHQLMRNLGLGSYRTAWFMAHRIREAMRDENPAGTEGMGGPNKLSRRTRATSAARQRTGPSMPRLRRRLSSRSSSVTGAWLPSTSPMSPPRRSVRSSSSTPAAKAR